MIIEIRGLVTETRSEQSGNFQITTLVVKTGEYKGEPETLAIKFFKSPENVKAGDAVLIGAVLKSRDHQGKFFTDINGYKIARLSRVILSDPTEAPKPNTNPAEKTPASRPDDLPF